MSQKHDISALRMDYARAGLHESELDADPIKQFSTWFDEAVEVVGGHRANEMTLATADAQGRPSARIVLLKGVDEGFVFFTNYLGRKGRQLAENPFASLVFWWQPMERQIRIEGRVEKVAAEVSDAYHASRPRGSQIGARASAQSEAVAARDQLEARVKAVEAEFEGQDIPRPDHWGGYRVIPERIEFWQGRPSRLHDRLCYSLQEDGTWDIVRLSP